MVLLPGAVYWEDPLELEVGPPLGPALEEPVTGLAGVLLLPETLDEGDGPVIELEPEEPVAGLVNVLLLVGALDGGVSEGGGV